MPRHIHVGQAQVSGVGRIPHNCSWRTVHITLAPEDLCIHTFRGQLARLLWQVTALATQAPGYMVSLPSPDQQHSSTSRSVFQSSWLRKA